MMLGSTKAYLPTFVSLALSTAVNAYFLAGNSNFLTIERTDPIVNPGTVSGHSHIVFGGSKFSDISSTAELLKSECTTMPIVEDKSNYWAPELYFQWANGSFTSVNGGAVIYYLFNDKPGTTTPFPPDFRMLSGNPTKRTYDANNPAQRAIDFLCLDFNGQTTKHNELPHKTCPSGIRSQVNFPSCWDGKNVDSPDHKSHVAFRSGGPDSGECTDPNYPVNIPRIFMEIYWDTPPFEKYRSQAMTPDQPFVFSYGDRTGYGNHADFFNGWQPGVLQKVVDGCNCNIYGDPQCCADKGIFTLQKNTQCRITKLWDEQTTGTIPKLPGNNPVQEAGKDAVMGKDNNVPGRLFPVYAYTGNSPTATGTLVVPPQTGAPQTLTTSSTTSSTVSTTSTSATTSANGGAPTTNTDSVTTTSTSTATETDPYVEPTATSTSTATETDPYVEPTTTSTSTATETDPYVEPTTTSTSTVTESDTSVEPTTTSTSTVTESDTSVEPTTTSTVTESDTSVVPTTTGTYTESDSAPTTYTGGAPAYPTTSGATTSPSTVSEGSATTSLPATITLSLSTTGAATTTRQYTRPATTLPASRPTVTRVHGKTCSKKGHRQHNYLKSGHNSHYKRYDFDVDDYYHMV